MRKALKALGLALGLAVSGEALAQAVVVRSTGPTAVQFPVGKRLPLGAPVVLKAGDIVTVLDRSGTRILRGAGSYTIDATPRRDPATVALLARSLAAPVSVRAGAVRGDPSGAGDEPIPVSVWIADIDSAGAGGGRVCLPRGSDLYLWRSKSDPRRFVWLGEAEGGGTVRVALPARTAGVAWPRTMLALESGHRYRIADADDPAKGTEFELVLLDPERVPADAAGLGTLLLDNGCRSQFDWLTSTLERLGEGQGGEGQGG